MVMQRRFTSLTCIGLLSLLIPTAPAVASNLLIDFGNTVDIDNSPTQSGYQAFNAVDKVLSGPTGVARTQQYASDIGIGGVVDLTISIPPGENRPLSVVPDNRRAVNRGTASTGNLPDLAQDWIGIDTRDGDGARIMSFTLSDLAAGTYTMTSYHQDTGNLDGTFDVLVNGVFETSGTMVMGDPGVGIDPVSVQYSFDANGVDDVTLTYDTTGGIFFLANGFELESGGDSLNVDFQATGGATEAGFMAYDAMDGIDGSPDGVTRVETYTSALGNAGTVDLTVAIEPFLLGGPAVDDNARAIYRSGDEYNGELANLAIDWIGADARTGGFNESIMVTLGNLQEGVYEVTSYHHDPQNLTGDLNVLVNGVPTAVASIATGDPGVDGAPGSVTFLISADGSSPVEIEYALAEFSLGPPLQAFPLINGIDVTLIPEPATIWLCGLGAMGLLAGRLRRYV